MALSNKTPLDKSEEYIDMIFDCFTKSVSILLRKYDCSHLPSMCIKTGTSLHKTTYTVLNKMPPELSTKSCLALACCPASFLSSYELVSTDESGHVKAGAIRTASGSIVEIAGFSPYVNEALVLIIAREFKLIDDERLKEIAKRSNNQMVNGILATLNAGIC